MSQIVTTKVGRFRHVTPDAWLWECPCGQWSYLTTDQWAGRVSVDHASQGCPVKYHETHNYEAELVATMQARILTGEPPIDPESPVEPTPEPPTNPPCARCGHALSAHRPEFGACDGRDRPCACPEYQVPTVEPEPPKWRYVGDGVFTAAKVEPEPCVWRTQSNGYLQVGCRPERCVSDGLIRDYAPTHCLWCGSPLMVER